MKNPASQNLNPAGIRFQDIFCLNKKNLVANLISRNLKIKYRQSILGLLWTILIPAFTALVYYVVFHFVIKVRMENYLFFILCGLLPWQFVSSCLLQGLESIQGNHHLLNKVPMPPQAFPLAETLTLFLNLILSVPILIVVGFASGISPSSSWLLIPLIILALFFITYFWAFILAIIYIFFRDLKHLMSIGVQILFYATPVLYNQAMIPENFFPWLYLNPWAGIFLSSQKILVLGQFPSREDLLSMGVWVVVLAAVSFILLRKFRYVLAEKA